MEKKRKENNNNTSRKSVGKTVFLGCKNIFKTEQKNKRLLLKLDLQLLHFFSRLTTLKLFNSVLF